MINQLIIDEDFNADKQPGRPKPDYKICSSQHLTHVRIQQPLNVWKESYTIELQKLRELDSVDPHITSEYPDQLLKRFKWNEFILKADKKQQVEDLLVELSDIFS